MHLVYALKDDVLTHVSDVERGLACGCKCPYCDEELIARKGKKREHHFAHKSGSECEHAYESSLHLMAKEILGKAEKIFLPWAGVNFLSLERPWVTVQEEGEFIIEHAELEKRFDGVIPDVVIYVNGRPVFVEIFVTHRIDDEKLGKLKELGIPTLEIDLSNIKESVTKEDLSGILLGESLDKHWKYHPDAEKARKEIYQAAHSLPISEIWDGEWGWTEAIHCPINGRLKTIWPDCKHCEHYIWNFDDHILCSHKPYKEPVKKLRRKSVKKPELIKKPEPAKKSEPEPEKPKKPKKIFSSFDDRDYKEKMKSLYEQMDREKKSAEPEPPKSVPSYTEDIVREILLSTKRLTVPGKNLCIGRTEQDDDGRIILYVIYEESVHVVFSPEEWDGHSRTLFIDLGLMNKFVTRKRFAEALINDPTVKQWLNKEAP